MICYRKGENMPKLLFATQNAHKLTEVRMILQDTGLEIIGAKELNLPDIAETGKTFTENALIKAKTAYNLTGLPTLAEDAGLCITALNNEPGIYSARYAKENGGFPAVFQVLTKRMKGIQDRNACFHSVMALVWGKEKYKTFEGVSKGTWAMAPTGENGFGYDPMFIPAGYTQTLGELGEDVKNTLSHRYRSLTQVLEYLKTHPVTEE